MSIQTILSGLDSSREAREALYRYFHRNPELSLQEYRTAERIERELRPASSPSCATAKARWSRCAATSTGCPWPIAPAWTTPPKA